MSSARAEIARRAREWYERHKWPRDVDVTNLIVAERDRALAEVEAMLNREAECAISAGWGALIRARDKVRRMRAELQKGGG